MERSLTKRLLLGSFWLSVLLHLLLLLSFTTVFFVHTDKPEQNKKPPNLFVPSYVYSGGITPSHAPQKVAQRKAMPSVKPQEEQLASSAVTSSLHDDHASFVSSKDHTKESKAREKKTPSIQKSVMTATREVLQENQRRAITSSKESEPIYLIGDANQPADPFIKLIGRALSAHFEYPRVAGELGIQGRVIVRMTIHPEGYFSDIQVLNSSDNQDLDAAALYAINSAPTVIGADRFITKPKHLVIGFIFR